MTLKIKIIILSAIALIVLLLTIGAYFYVSCLNNKILELETTISNKNDEIHNLNTEIDTLKCNIESLKKEVSSLHSTINVTSNYLEKVENVYTNEDALKQTIYEEVISNEEAKDWFSEKLPNDLIDLLNTSYLNGMCDN